MKYLLDTHLLLCIAKEPHKLTQQARDLLATPSNVFVFSAISIWEVAIKQLLNRPDWRADATELRSGFLQNDYAELTFTGAHAAATLQLPSLHQDPFDRALIAQAIVEGLVLLTSDKQIRRYSGPILLI